MVIQKGQRLRASLDEEGVRRATEKYCQHLRDGYPKLMFYYRDDDGYHCNHEVLEKYIKEDPEKYYVEASLILEADLAGLRGVYDLGMKMAKGGKELVNANARAWETIIRNKGKKYGWEQGAFVNIQGSLETYHKNPGDVE